MPFTARHVYYPNEGDTPDVPRDLTTLANRVDAEFVQMTGAAFAAASPDANLVGRRIRITTTGGGYTSGQVFLDIGTAFVADSTDLSNAQPLDADLTAIAGLPSAADRLLYATGSNAWSLAVLTAFARTILDDPDATTALATLGAQASDADLTAIAGLSSAADKLPYATGVNAWALTTLSTFIRTLLDDSDAATARATLGAAAPIILGDGFDGSPTLDGATNFNNFSSRAGAVYTLTRDVYAVNFTVNAGSTLNTAGYRIFCTGTFTNAGTVQNVGQVGGTGTNTNGSGTGGAGGVSGYFLNGGAGGQGTDAGVATTGGTGGARTSSLGANGGAGGAGAVGAGGAGGSATTPTAVNGGIPHLINALIRGVDKAGNAFQAGAGGGGGGGGNASAGGGGGGGGGIVLIAAAVINNTGTISAKGGNGGAQSGNAGPGGGGGGGSIILGYRVLTAIGTTSVAGGTGATAGVAGTLYQYQL